MTQELSLLRLIGEVDDRHLQFAEGSCPAGMRAHPIALKWVAIVACFAVLLAGCAAFMSVYLPPKEPPEKKDDFIMSVPMRTTWVEYDGRTYSFYQYTPTPAMTVGETIGEGVCFETGESAQNTTLYAVKGIDPSFMVSTVYGHVFICDGDITLRTGADIFEQRLRLKERYQRLEHSGWVDGESVQLVIEKQYHDDFERFLEALCAGQCVSIDDVTRVNGKGMHSILDNGLRVRLVLYDGGYVEFDGLDAAVQMEPKAFDEFRELLKEQEGSPWKTVTYPDWDAIKAEKEAATP